MHNAPDMKVRLSIALRRQIEEAAALNNRTLNAEIVSRLERTFREDAEHRGDWLAAAQASPRIRMEKELVRMELQLQHQIEELDARLTKLEGTK